MYEENFVIKGYILCGRNVLGHLFVFLPYRNEKIATKLLREAESFLSKERKAKCYVRTNASLINFYENKGFKVESCVLMSKRLRKKKKS